MQPIFDNLYRQSKNNSKFKHLFNIIASDENILLAYRNIKRNKGSTTAGVNHKTIKFWKSKPLENFLQYIKSRLQNYFPQSVRRVNILKSNGKIRPLGIPCIEDRVIQQCIKQVLEPICEAKFHPHSYGFRPNRNTKHAVAYLTKKINLDNMYHVVDIDIQGFFDNVNHSKLLKQLWNMGIHDKRVLSIIGKMLRCNIDGNMMTKGVPQGGILSPLLSNIVLNELDWWIANQWEYFDTKRQYSTNGNFYKHLRRFSKLKEMYIVRYADDFKIICREKEGASKAFIAVKKWLKERLSLEISPEKSSVTDVRRHGTEFLGFKLKAYKKSYKWIVKSTLVEKAIKHSEETLKKQIKRIQKRPIPYNVYIFNRLIAGLHKYYEIATKVNKVFSKISYRLSYCLKKRLKSIKTKSGLKTKEYLTRYRKYKGKEIYVLKNIIYPIYGVSNKPAYSFNQRILDYTEEGRKFKHQNLGYTCKEMLKFLSTNYLIHNSIELNDNRLSLYTDQRGLCAISKAILDESLEIHHIIPIKLGGTDRYNNLCLVTKPIHILIHATENSTIQKYLKRLKLDSNALKKLNNFRMKVGNEIIVMN